MTTQTQPWQEAVSEVWQLFKETDARLDARFKETDARLDARFKETDARFKETDARFKETDARFKETDARLDARFKETDARFKETDAQIKETDRKIRELFGLFGNQWGRMVEALVEPRALAMFRERGIAVHQSFQRVKVKSNGRVKMEIDLLLANQDVVVAIEIKSVLKVEDVDEFLKKMERFLEFFPQYRGYKVYGGVAGLDITENAGKYAYRRGVFVIAATGEGTAKIKNDKKFKPRNLAKSMTT